MTIKTIFDYNEKRNDAFYHDGLILEAEFKQYKLVIETVTNNKIYDKNIDQVFKGRKATKHLLDKGIELKDAGDHNIEVENNNYFIAKFYAEGVVRIEETSYNIDSCLEIFMEFIRKNGNLEDE